MTYLLIALVLLVILSPLMWFRQSPRQKLIIDMRKKASSLGLVVNLSSSPAAREAAARFDCVAYMLPWISGTEPSPKPRMESWLLVSHSTRGDSSLWPEWRWISRKASSCLTDIIEITLSRLPANVNALEARANGLVVYWKEAGELQDVIVIHKLLSALRKNIRCD
jgi:hypothetical protein